MLTHGMRALFLATPAIVALVPAQTVGRVSLPSVFVENVPQGVKPPYVVIKQVELDPLMTLDSTYHATGNLQSVDIDAVSYSKPNANSLNSAIRSLFQDYEGVVTADDIDDRILAVTWQDEAYDYDYPDDGGDKKQHTVTSSYSVLVRENV